MDFMDVLVLAIIIGVLVGVSAALYDIKEEQEDRAEKQARRKKEQEREKRKQEQRLKGFITPPEKPEQLERPPELFKRKAGAVAMQLWRIVLGCIIGALLGYLFALFI